MGSSSNRALRDSEKVQEVARLVPSVPSAMLAGIETAVGGSAQTAYVSSRGNVAVS
jgi:hypothetical protein